MGGKEIKSYEGTPSPITGRKAQGEIMKEDVLRLKAGLEARRNFLVLEWGVIYTPTNEETTERIIGKTGTILSENSYSVAGNKIDYFGGAGIEVGKIGKLKARFIIGGETGKGVYGKVGLGIPISKN